MSQIVACSSHTFLRHFPQHLDDLRAKVLLKETPVIGGLLLNNTHNIETTGADKIQFPLISPGESLTEFIDGIYDAELYDVQRASIRSAHLVKANKATEGKVAFNSNAADYMIELQLRGVSPNPPMHTLGDDCSELFNIVTVGDTLSEKIPLMPLYAEMSPVKRAHQQLLGVFGQELLDNATLKIDYKGSPHRLISAFHLVASFIAIKETLEFVVVALGEQLEPAEIFLIPEPIFQRLAKMCYDLYVEHWDYIDATQFKFEVICEQATQLEVQLEWVFDLPLKRLPDSLPKEEIIMLTQREPSTVLALVSITDPREYTIRKKSAYDSPAKGENQ